MDDLSITIASLSIAIFALYFCFDGDSSFGSFLVWLFLVVSEIWLIFQ